MSEITFILPGTNTFQMRQSGLFEGVEVDWDSEVQEHAGQNTTEFNLDITPEEHYRLAQNFKEIEYGPRGSKPDEGFKFYYWDGDGDLDTQGDVYSMSPEAYWALLQSEAFKNVPPPEPSGAAALVGLALYLITDRLVGSRTNEGEVPPRDRSADPDKEVEVGRTGSEASKADTVLRLEGWGIKLEETHEFPDGRAQQVRPDSKTVVFQPRVGDDGVLTGVDAESQTAVPPRGTSGEEGLPVTPDSRTVYFEDGVGVEAAGPPRGTSGEDGLAVTPESRTVYFEDGVGVKAAGPPRRTGGEDGLTVTAESKTVLFETRVGADGGVDAKAQTAVPPIRTSGQDGSPVSKGELIGAIGEAYGASVWAELGIHPDRFEGSPELLDALREKAAERSELSSKGLQKLESALNQLLGEALSPREQASLWIAVARGQSLEEGPIRNAIITIDRALERRTGVGEAEKEQNRIRRKVLERLRRK